MFIVKVDTVDMDAMYCRGDRMFPVRMNGHYLVDAVANGLMNRR